MSKKEGIRQEECVWGPLHGCKFATEIEKEGETWRRKASGRIAWAVGKGLTWSDMSTQAVGSSVARDL